MADPPPGFVYVARAPFVNHVGPMYQAEDDPPGAVTLGLRVAEVHINTMGFMHGGMIATLCDSAMARALITKLHRRTVTLRMAMEYFDATRRGEWLEAHARLVSEDGEVGMTECRVLVDGALRARATGVFRLLRKV